nr:hypothetical protein [Tanacetum cinerariifolium]
MIPQTMLALMRIPFKKVNLQTLKKFGVRKVESDAAKGKGKKKKCKMEPDHDVVKVDKVCDDLEVNEFMEFVVKSSRIVTLCIVESSVNAVVGSPKTKKPYERDLLDDEKLRPFGEKIMGSVFGKVKRLSGEVRVVNLMRMQKQHPL